MKRFLPGGGMAFLLALILSFATGSVSFSAETIRIRAGFQQVLERSGVSRLSVGNPEIVEAQPLPRGDGILVVGKKEGETDLVLWEKSARTVWHVEVGSRKGSVVEDARSFAGAFPGLTVVEAGGSVLVSGPVSTPLDKTVLEEYARAHPGVHLRLSLPDEKKTLLLYDLKILEISRGETARLGIHWPEAIPAKGTFAVGTGNEGTFSVGTDFEARLNLLMADGKARILSNPRLACESGGEAQFLAGGEIPIVIITPETRTHGGRGEDPHYGERGGEQRGPRQRHFRRPRFSDPARLHPLFHAAGGNRDAFGSREERDGEGRRQGPAARPDPGDRRTVQVQELPREPHRARDLHHPGRGDCRRRSGSRELGAESRERKEQLAVPAARLTKRFT
ncbi:MAG: secretion protein [Deltaproteobacteria bacterium]|nr:secretion protein [Deltaproteobacteria bacterium]